MFYLATHVFSLDLSCCLTDSRYLRTVSYADGKLTKLKRLRVASGLIDAATVNTMLQGTSCLQELDMTDAFITDDVCEVITEFASHSLRVLYLPQHISFWSSSRISRMLDNCKELVTLAVDGDMVNFNV